MKDPCNIYALISVEEAAARVFYLDNTWVCEDFIQNLKFVPPGPQCIYDPVFFSRANLHQRDNSDVRMPIMMFEINSNLFSLFQFVKHRLHSIQSIDPRRLNILEGKIGYRIRLAESGNWIP